MSPSGVYAASVEDELEEETDGGVFLVILAGGVSSTGLRGFLEANSKRKRTGVSLGKLERRCELDATRRGGDR